MKVHEQAVVLPGYRDAKTGKPETIRQAIITGHGKIKPAVMPTGGFDPAIAATAGKYGRSRLVEKDISRQIDFFHFNRVSSSMVIKVDFDLSMSILAHNLYRLPALSLNRYRHLSDERIHEKFIVNNGEIEIEPAEIRIDLKKKRELPPLIDCFKELETVKYPWLNDKNVNFNPAAST